MRPSSCSRAPQAGAGSQCMPAQMQDDSLVRAWGWPHAGVRQETGGAGAHLRDAPCVPCYAFKSGTFLRVVNGCWAHFGASALVCMLSVQAGYKMLPCVRSRAPHRLNRAPPPQTQSIAFFRRVGALCTLRLLACRICRVRAKYRLGCLTTCCESPVRCEQ